MTQLHNSTQYISRDGKRTRTGYDPGWIGHADKEMKRRRAHNKVAKQARKVNRAN